MDVEDVWASMQRESGVSKDRDRGRRGKTAPSTKPRATAAAAQGEGGGAEGEAAKETSLEQLMKELRSLASALDSQAASTRRQTLTRLDALLFDGSGLDLNYSTLFRELCKPLFRRIADPVEKCRELALRLVVRLIGVTSDLAPLLGYLFPCLLQRVQPGVGYDEGLKLFVSDLETHEAFKRGRAVERQDQVAITLVVEPSEECRLLVCRALEALVAKLVALDVASILQPYFSETVLILQAQLRDPFPDLRLSALSLLQAMAEHPEFELGMKFYAVGLVRAVLPSLRHRHARVRVAAVQCMRACMVVPDRDKRKAAGSEAIMDLVGFREENVLQVAAFYRSDVTVNYLAELVGDNSALVREALADALTVLLTEIGDRYDHHQRLLPYVLDLLMDDVPQIAGKALRCLQLCGKEFEEEHREEVLEQRQYGVDGDASINLSKPLPPPFASRPPLALRLYVRANTKRFLGALLNELTNWISKTRLKSAGLLRMVVVLCEEHLTMEAFSVIPAVVKALDFAKADKDQDLQSALLGVAELLGRYVAPDTSVRYILPRISGDPSVVQFATDASSRCTVMQVLGAMLEGSRPLLVADKFVELVEVLCDEYIVTPESSSLRQHALDVLCVVLAATHRELRAVVEGKYALKGRVHCVKKALASLLFDLHSDALRSQASDCVRHLAAIFSNQAMDGMEQLFCAIGGELLEEHLSEYEVDADWSAAAPSHAVLSLLLRCPLLTSSRSFSYADASRQLCAFVSRSEAKRLPSRVLTQYLETMARLMQSLVASASLDEVRVPQQLRLLLGEVHQFDTVGQASRLLRLREWLRLELLTVADSFLLGDAWDRCDELMSARFDVLDELLECWDSLEKPQREYLLLAVLSRVVPSSSSPSIPVPLRFRAVSSCALALDLCAQSLPSHKLTPIKTTTQEQLKEANSLSARLRIHGSIELLLLLLDDPDDSILLEVLKSLSYCVPFLGNTSDLEDLFSLEVLLKRVLQTLLLTSVPREAEFLALSDRLLRSVAVLDTGIFANVLREHANDITLASCNEETKDLIAGLNDHVSLMLSF